MFRSFTSSLPIVGPCSLLSLVSTNDCLALPSAFVIYSFLFLSLCIVKCVSWCVEIHALLMFCLDAHEHCRLSFSGPLSRGFVYYAMTTYITETKSSVCLS